MPSKARVKVIALELLELALTSPPGHWDGFAHDRLLDYTAELGARFDLLPESVQASLDDMKAAQLHREREMKSPACQATRRGGPHVD